MAHALYLDVHIPAAITQALRQQQVDVLTSQDDGTREVEDAVLLDRATALGRVIVTQDADFRAIAAEWQRSGRAFAGIIYLPMTGASLGQVTEDLILLAECTTAEELANRVTHVPLR